MLPMLAPEPATTSAIVAAVNPLVAKTSVAASRIRCWVAPVFAQRRACAEVAIPPTLSVAHLRIERPCRGADLANLGGGRCVSGAQAIGWSVRTRRTGSEDG